MNRFQSYIMDDQADFNKYLLELEALIGFGRAHSVADGIVTGGRLEKTGASERLRQIVTFCRQVISYVNLPSPDGYSDGFELNIEPPDIEISMLDIDNFNLFYQNWKAELKFKIQNGKWIFCPKKLS